MFLDAEMRFIKPIERQSQHTSSKPKNIHFMPSSYQIKQQPVQLILNSYQVHDFDASRRATKPKALNTKYKSNNNRISFVVIGLRIASSKIESFYASLLEPKL